MKRGRKPKCPQCGASQNIAKGHRPTVTMGLRKLRFCKSCLRKFTVGSVAVIPPGSRQSVHGDEPETMVEPAAIDSSAEHASDLI